MIDIIQSALVGKPVAYRAFDGGFELPVKRGSVTDVSEHVVDGVLRGYAVSFDNGIPTKVVPVQKAKGIDFGRNVTLSPYFYESAGTTTWFIKVD
jgi:hypothetical protein